MGRPRTVSGSKTGVGGNPRGDLVALRAESRSLSSWEQRSPTEPGSQSQPMTGCEYGRWGHLVAGGWRQLEGEGDADPVASNPGSLLLDSNRPGQRG